VREQNDWKWHPVGDQVAGSINKFSGIVSQTVANNDELTGSLFFSSKGDLLTCKRKKRRTKQPEPALEPIAKIKKRRRRRRKPGG